MPDEQHDRDPARPADDACAPPGARPAPVPAGERARLRALREAEVLDTAPETLFDDIARLAALICGTPIALISLVDEERQWFKARVGLGATETHRDMAFCAHAILAPDQLFEVPDTHDDDRFRHNPLVQGDPRIRFYAGMPIVLPGGESLGTVCAIDRQPRELTAAQREALQALARQVSQMLHWRRTAAREAARLRDEAGRQRERLWQLTATATHELALQSFVNRDHVYRYVNDRYLEYWDVEREAIEGRPVAEVVGQEVYAQRVRPLLAQALAGEAVEYFARFPFPGRGARQMHVQYLPVRAPSGEVLGVVVRSEDVEEMEQARAALATANDKLQQRNEVLERFVQMMSHDVREPVNTIQNFAGLLERQAGPTLDEAGRRSLAFIRRGGQRLQALLDDLLEYVRLEGSDSELLHAGPVDLAALFEGLREDLADAIGQSAARIDAGPLPVVHGNATLLRVLFQNLVSNALKFHAPDRAPEVAYGSVVREGGVEVWVRDRGIGIPEGRRGRLFTPFSRLVSRSQFEGTGLGLAICRRIAELHGGRITIDSQPGKGSTFSVLLPAVSAGAAP